MKRILSLVIMLATTFTGVETLFSQTVSLSTLLDELTDPAAVTRRPNYSCRQFSSFDRAAKSTDENWFANNDASNFLRSEKNGDREEWVLMETEGPGAIVRWWITAGEYVCNFYVYIDGQEKPVLTGKSDELVGGEALVSAPLSAVTSRGRNLYLPIPYQKSIKITCDRMPEQRTLYYQINYRTYQEEVNVESFSLGDFEKLRDKVVETNERLMNPKLFSRDEGGRSERQGYKRHIPAEMLNGLYGEQRIFGPGAITEIEVKLSAKDIPLASRNVAILISFDGEETVWAPVGEFFGSGVGINPFCSWRSETLEDGTYRSFWRMPYQREARVSFMNYGQQDVDLSYAVYYEKAPWTSDSMYFHANWRQERGIETQGGKGVRDWNYTAIKGAGLYVGDVLSVYNPVSDWWGEGDEKIYVDGESFPSHFGTGTEDYYGYAWCCPDFFDSPFHAQPRAEGPGNFGNTTILRYRLLDGVPFEKSLKFDMEIWHWTTCKVDYSVTTFWYGAPGSEIDATVGPSRQDFEDECAESVQYDHRYSVKFRNFNFEGLSLGASGTATVQNMTEFKNADNQWLDDKQIWWRDGKFGDKMTLAIEEAKKGKKTLVVGATCARDYGIAQFYWNGKPVGEPIDFFNAPDVIHKVVRFEIPEIQEEKGTLTVELMGRNNKSVGEMLGVDSVDFE